LAGARLRCSDRKRYGLEHDQRETVPKGTHDRATLSFNEPWHGCLGTVPKVEVRTSLMAERIQNAVHRWMLAVLDLDPLA